MCGGVVIVRIAVRAVVVAVICMLVAGACRCDDSVLERMCSCCVSPNRRIDFACNFGSHLFGLFSAICTCVWVSLSALCCFECNSCNKRDFLLCCCAVVCVLCVFVCWSCLLLWPLVIFLCLHSFLTGDTSMVLFSVFAAVKPTDVSFVGVFASGEIIDGICVSRCNVFGETNCNICSYLPQ